MPSDEITRLLQLHAAQLDDATRQVTFEDLGGNRTTAAPAPRQWPARVAPVALAIVLILILGGTALFIGDPSEQESTNVVTTLGAPTTLAPASTTQAPSTTLAPSTTTEPSDATGITASIELEMREISPPLWPDSGVLPWYADLHESVGTLSELANDLGAAALALDSYPAGWEDQEPFGGDPDISLAGRIDAELADLAGIIREILEPVGYLSANCDWVLTGEARDDPLYEAVRDLWHTRCWFQVEAMAGLFEQRTERAVIDYWNGPTGPWGHISDAVEVVDHLGQSIQVGHEARVRRDWAHIGMTIDAPALRSLGWKLIETTGVGDGWEPGVDGQLHRFERTLAAGDQETIIALAHIGTGEIFDALRVQVDPGDGSFDIRCTDGEVFLVLEHATAGSIRAWQPSIDWSLREVPIEVYAESGAVDCSTAGS